MTLLGILVLVLVLAAILGAVDMLVPSSIGGLLLLLVVLWLLFGRM